MYKISIIIPIFNVEKYLKRALDSILNQSMELNEIEVIMVDDCSTDNSKNIIKEYADRYSNFTGIFLKKNSGGPAEPRNTGLKLSSGKYIMFLDPDDEFAQDMCETMYNKIEETTAEYIKCNYEIIFNNTSRLAYQFDKHVPEIEINCKKEIPPKHFSVCMAIHNKNFLNDNNITFSNLKNAEDMYFSMKEYLNANKLIYLNNYHGYKYYIHQEASHSMKSTSENLNAILDAFIKTKKIIEKNGRKEILKPYFSDNGFAFFLRLLDYKYDKKEYLKKFYDFEKSLNCTLIFKPLWLKVINSLIIRKRFKMAEITLNLFNIIRKSPLIKYYRKILK